MERLVSAPRPILALSISFASMTAAWFIYVPIHELLHVAGCVLTGGTVSELEIQAAYGGHLLAAFLPFVVVGGEYSGRLSGFDTRGSDLIYLATDIAPYLLTVFLGVPMLRLCARSCRPWLMGPALVVGTAPFYNLLGDFYEMGSIVATRLLSIPRGASPPIFESLRSDDLVSLVGTLISSPAELGIQTGGAVAMAGMVVALSAGIGLVLSVGTYALGGLWADLLLGRSEEVISEEPAPHRAP